MSKKIDLTGKKFGRLTVLREATEKKYINGEILWECKCDCGSEKLVYPCGSQLRQGAKKSCGCLWNPTKEEYLNRLKQKLEENCKWNAQCQEWTGFKDSDGYGKISVTLNAKERPLSVHRVSWMIHIGNIPEGMCICHHCDNPACFRPEHLFLGTQQDNMDDKMNKKRHRTPKGESTWNVKITEFQAKEIFSLKNSGITSHDLAKKYNTAASNIRQIWQKRSWKHIHEEKPEESANA